MDKTVLEQYVELKEEIKDLHNRIDRDRRRLVKIENEGAVLLALNLSLYISLQWEVTAPFTRCSPASPILTG